MLDKTLEGYYEYIQNPEVKEAFIYLIDYSKELHYMDCHPHPHGYINRNYHYFFNNISHYAFVINRNWLLFYIQRINDLNQAISLKTLKENFPTVKFMKRGKLISEYLIDMIQ